MLLRVLNGKLSLDIFQAAYNNCTKQRGNSALEAGHEMNNNLKEACYGLSSMWSFAFAARI